LSSISKRGACKKKLSWEEEGKLSQIDFLGEEKLTKFVDA
jgi:hypothetical protein